MAKSILYYPTIDIKNEKWLKSAVLYWDQVCTIVPYTSYDDFSGNIRYLEERDQFRRLYPADMFFSEYYDEFAGEIERKAHNLIRKRRKCKKGYFDDSMDIIQDGTLYSLIHYKKIPTEIFDWLQKKNLIRFNDKMQWVEMDKEFSLVYMKVLAKYIAKSAEEELDFGTDRISKMDSFFYRTKPKAGNEVLSIILEKCLPVPREDVPFEDLIDFKERRQDDLFELHKKINDLKVNLVSCKRREELKASIADFNHS